LSPGSKTAAAGALRHDQKFADAAKTKTRPHADQLAGMDADLRKANPIMKKRVRGADRRWNPLLARASPLLFGNTFG